MAGQLGAVDGEDGLLQSLSEPLEPLGGFGPLGNRELEGGCHADRTGNVLRAAAAVALLGAALLLGEDVRPMAEVEGTDALRPLELVGAHHEEVDAERR